MDAAAVACVVLGLAVIGLIGLIIWMTEQWAKERQALLRCARPGFVIEDHRPRDEEPAAYGTDAWEAAVERRRKGEA